MKILKIRYNVRYGFGWRLLGQNSVKPDLSVKKTKRAHCSAPFLFKRESLGPI
jgi:hypothetical protein